MKYDQLRNDVFGALNSAYVRDAGSDWFGCKYSDLADATSLTRQMTTDILAMYVAHNVDPSPRSDGLFRDISNYVWMYYAGGGTALNTAKKICKILNVEVDDED